MAAGCEIPYQAWKKSGDLQALRAAYPGAKALVEFMVRHIDPKVGLPQFGFYGDWVALKKSPNSATSSFSFMLAVSRLVEMAAAVHEPADHKHYTATLAGYKQAWHHEYYKHQPPPAPAADGMCTVDGKQMECSCNVDGKLSAVAMECEANNHPPPACGTDNTTRLVRCSFWNRIYQRQLTLC
jgi:hypothetical protein